MLPYNTVVLTVGFERIFTSDYEDIGTLDLCVQIDTVTTNIFIPSNTHIYFSLSLNSVTGTAGAIKNDKYYRSCMIFYF